MTEGPTTARWRWWAVAALVLAVVVALGVAVAVGGDDTESDRAAPSGSTTSSPGSASTGSSTGSSTSTSGAAGDVGSAAAASVLWPAPGDAGKFGSPDAAAQSFAAEFLGFVDPVVGPYEAGDTRSGEVPVRPRRDGPVTTIHVRQVAGEAWSVLGASTDDIVVEAPTAWAVVDSPVAVRGKAWAFEGHVDVQVRADGRREPVGTGFVTGGGDELRPFSGRIGFDAGGVRTGAVVFLVHSAEDGRVWQAAAVRVGVGRNACAAPTPEAGPGQMIVTVHFTCAEAVRPARRVVPSAPAVLRASLDALVEGPTSDEERAGLTSSFSPKSAGAVRSVTLSSGHAVVDFVDLSTVLPAAATAAAADRRQVLAELDATVFQFNSVTDVEYRIAGDCRRFAERFGLGGDACSTPRTRDVATR